MDDQNTEVTFEPQPVRPGQISAIDSGHEQTVHDADLVGWKVTRQRGLVDGDTSDAESTCPTP